MPIPKNDLQNAMKSSRIIKPDETLDLKLMNESNNTNLTFRRSLSNVFKESNNYQDVAMLLGSEKKITISLCEKKEKSDDKKIVTKPIKLSILSKEISISIVTLKKSIQRLEKKGFIIRDTFKPGRGGWTVYSIPLLVYKSLLKEK